MTTTPLSIAETLKYAQLQMAAEAFLFDEEKGKLKTDLVTALTEGNHHASKFPTKEAAEDFLDHWQVVAQQANTASPVDTVLEVNRFLRNPPDKACGF